MGTETDVDGEDDKEEKDAGEREQEDSARDPAKNKDDSSLIAGDGVSPENESENAESWWLEGLASSKLGSRWRTAEMGNERCDGVSTHSDGTVQ